MRILGLPPLQVVLSSDGPAIRWRGRGAAPVRESAVALREIAPFCESASTLRESDARTVEERIPESRVFRRAAPRAGMTLSAFLMATAAPAADGTLPE